ncbi:MAG TPA: dihydroorotase [Bacteroidales bacterium]|nr:dihydroorotase [Bacteroidales bacterium]
MGTILIKNAIIVNEGKSKKGDLLIKDGTIMSTGVDLEPAKDCTIIDATGKILIPGVIDDQVHFRQPGLTHKGDIFSESRAAAAGGITSFMEMPNTIPQTVTASALKEKMKIGSENSMVNFSFYIGATNDNLDEIMKVDPKEVCGIKLFMGSSTGNMLVDNEQALKELFSKSTMIITAHCEDEQEIRKNTELYKRKYGENIPVKVHPLIRSREACFESSSKAVHLALQYNTRLHILHLSTADEMKLFRHDLPLQEKRITAEVCVHHLWYDESSYESSGTRIKWNPAIKTRYDRDALRQAVNNNTIDVIATDHAPHTFEEKQNKYLQCPSGGPLVQHSLVMMLELWHRKIFGLEKIVQMMCHNPAILFNVKKRGFIREGYMADLCIIDPSDPWMVEQNNILYKCGWSPLEGTTFRSKVLTTIVNGNIVYDNGIFNEEYRGELLKFDR